VYGPRNFKLLGSTILDAAVERYAGIEALKVHDERLEMRLVHVADLVAACMHLATTDDAVGRAFNVVSPHYPSSHEVAELVTAELSMGMELDSDPDCGPGYEERRRVHRRMLDDGMEDAILLSKERLRFLRKTNRNNRLSVDALLATGFEFTRPDLGGGIAETVAWYRDHRWII
jgi:nucleoside-diphosphate-sugar epimerase